MARSTRGLLARGGYSRAEEVWDAERLRVGHEERRSAGRRAGSSVQFGGWPSSSVQYVSARLKAV
ncbi:MAG TPA: hypothetical protein VFY98_09605 [Intrasporangium sp.]|nr:hypothetical protein [Intrasporangium sp.]